MATYHSTAEVLDAIVGQVEKTVGRETDATFKFIGSLNDAVQSHFGQRGGADVKLVVAITLGEVTSPNLTANGNPLTLAMPVSMYVVSRMKRATYEEDTDRVLQVIDALTFDAFDCDKTTSDYKARVAGNRFQGWAPLVTPDLNFMAFRVDWEIRPKRT